MSRQRLGFLLVAASAFAGLTALRAGQNPTNAPPAKQPDAKAGRAEEGPSPDADLTWLENASQKDSPLRKVNGVSFDIGAKVDRQDAGDVIVIAWRLSYDGPRQPLIIVEPTVAKKTNAATRVTFYAVPEGKKAGWACDFVSGFQEVRLAPPLDPTGAKDGTLAKEVFIEVEYGKQAKGEIAIPASQLRKQLAQRRADRFFDPKVPPQLFVEVRHAPTDRGEKHSLDAWTGTLRSDLIAVPRLKNW